VTVPDGPDTVWVETPAGDGFAFDWELAARGMQDSFPVFALVFAAFVVVKMLWMAGR